ncbi:DnaJ domain-containing protein [bacterium]|nr:DnaJ domain-containing protein [bacterium]
MKNNYYDILGVTPDSEASDIKTSYRRLARKYHPDINPDSIDKFKEINEAYSTLSDEKKRMQYDMLFGFYKKGKSTQSETKKPETENSEKGKEKKTTDREKTETKTQKSTTTNKSKTNEKNFFDDLFNQKEDKPVKQKGSDITTEVSITIAEANNGTTKIVNIVHTELCKRCKGRKFINGSYCPDCAGTGEVSHVQKLTVTIPAGVKNETKLRLTGEGNKGINGGENGDLYLIIKIKSTSSVHFSGKTMYCDIPIQPFEAVLGTVIKVQSPNGTISVKIPPRTRSGQKFRICQQIDGKENEIFVTVHVEIPSYLSDDEIRLYEKLKKVSSCDIRENYLDA